MPGKIDDFEAICEWQRCCHGPLDEVNPWWAYRGKWAQTASKERFCRANEFCNSLVNLALVTGASSGLGEALARRLSEQGVSLILTGRNENALNSLVQQLPTPARYLILDLSIKEDCQKLIQEIATSCPDLVINNAGFGLYGDALDHTMVDQLEMIDVNVTSVIALSLGAAHVWKKRGKKGTVLNVASAAAFFSYPSFAIYAASKACILQFSTAFDQEVEPDGIRILTTCPGQIDTHFRKRAASGFPQKKDLLTMSPQKAARLILEQIKRGKRVQIIDWRYRWAVFLTRLVPKRLMSTYLRNEIKSRIRKDAQDTSRADGG